MMSVQSLKTSTDTTSVGEQPSFEVHPTLTTEAVAEVVEAHPTVDSP